MSAQLGGSVLLDYGPQGSQQLGGAVVLDFYVPPTTRTVRSGRHAGWGASAVTKKEVVAPHDATLFENVQRQAPWVLGVTMPRSEHSPWGLSTQHDQGADAPWGRFAGVAQPERASSWQVSRPSDEAAAAPWGSYNSRAQVEHFSAWVRANLSDHAAAAPWGGPMVTVLFDRDAAFSGSALRSRALHVPWRLFLRTISPGVESPIPPFDGVPDARVVVPVRSVYVQVNATSLRRVDGNVAIPTFSMNLGIDYASWVWTFNASIPADAMSIVEPVAGEPVELEALINGTAYRLLVERISRERTFGKAAIAISGRGKAALLDAPYAPMMNFGNDADDLSIAQLMDGALTLNGVSLGWSVDFGLTDWLVPTGVWSHSGSYMDAMNRLAEAGGGYVQADAALQTLHVLPKYPFAPWEWTTLVDPDIELPSAPVTRESIEWMDKPKYNRVYVQGLAGGIVGRITRAGTAGDLAAPTIVDALNTHVDAARQRGLPVLADTGRMAYIGLRLPVLAETGIITPGKFVRYVDGSDTRVGLVRSVNLDVAMPQVWQTIKLETHL